MGLLNQYTGDILEGFRQPIWQYGPTVYHAVQACPVCQGRGTVPKGFYQGRDAKRAREQCRQCAGHGLLTLGLGNTVVPTERTT